MSVALDSPKQRGCHSIIISIKSFSSSSARCGAGLESPLTRAPSRRKYAGMRAVSLALLLFLGALPLRADDAPVVAPDGSRQPGHSSHGEAFNEGPRQAAVLMPGTGHLHFPVTTPDPMAQRFFDQGVGQLHGFWYFEAERSFRQAAALDPDCAMAFWGMAMANINNGKRAAEFIKAAVALQAKASPREQRWIALLADYYAEPKGDNRERRQALVKGLERLSYDFPDDLEAKAFLVFWIWDNEEHGIPVPSHQALDALARQVLVANPEHPIHHYRIHLWNGDDDRRALDSAAVNGQVSPAIAHMWHMPGHTFTKLHRYADAAWQQEASARVDHAYMIAARILPEQIHNYAHNNDWLVEDLEYIGRAHDAIDLAKNMIELPRPAPKAAADGQLSKSEGGRHGYLMGRDRLLETALRFELWPELAKLDGSTYLAPSADWRSETERRLALGTAYYGLHDPVKGDAQLAALALLCDQAKTARLAAADEAETTAKAGRKSPAEVSAAMAAALQRFAERRDFTQDALAELRLAQALASDRKDDAHAQLRLAHHLEPERAARVYLQLGDLAEAEKAARNAVRKGEGQVLPLATLAAVQWGAGKKAGALTTFRKLLPLAAQVDLDAPAFARLAPLAEELHLADDWRPALAWPQDSGRRPDLSALGPFRWHPYEAPAWSLGDAAGQHHALADLRGQPVLVMFYLGSGCALCLEQLNRFSPVAQEFAAAGIQLVAVSTDAADTLHETVAKAKDGRGFPFPILADPALAAFRAYRAYDDFEKIPLHGTFLIDAAGLIRWQDISFEAFRDPAWLLAESQRLLALPAALPDSSTPAAR